MLLNRILSVKECDAETILNQVQDGAGCHAIAVQRTKRTSERGKRSLIVVLHPGSKKLSLIPKHFLKEEASFYI
jgi:excinuclease UvrABC nuclease subunit